MTLGVIVLASAVGGFAYSELRAERVREDTRQLREELSASSGDLRHPPRGSNTCAPSRLKRPAHPRGRWHFTGPASSEAILRYASLPRRANQCRRRDPSLRRGYGGARGAGALPCPCRPKSPGSSSLQSPTMICRLGRRAKVEFNHDLEGTRFADAPYDQMQGASIARSASISPTGTAPTGVWPELLVHYVLAIASARTSSHPGALTVRRAPG